MPYLVLVLISLFSIIYRSEVLMKDLCLPAEAAIDKSMLTYDPEEQIDGPDPITVVTRTNDGVVMDVATIDIDESAWVTDSVIIPDAITDQGATEITLPNLCNKVNITVDIPIEFVMTGCAVFQENASVPTTPGSGYKAFTSFTHPSSAMSVTIGGYQTYVEVKVLTSGSTVIGYNMFFYCSNVSSSLSWTAPANCYYYLFSGSSSNQQKKIALYGLTSKTNSPVLIQNIKEMATDGNTQVEFPITTYLFSLGS